jgi:hypothetical protein
LTVQDLASLVVEVAESRFEPGGEGRRRRWNWLLGRRSCIAAVVVVVAVGEEVGSIVEEVERRSGERRSGKERGMVVDRVRTTLRIVGTVAEASVGTVTEGSTGKAIDVAGRVGEELGTGRTLVGSLGVVRRGNRTAILGGRRREGAG